MKKELVAKPGERKVQIKLHEGQIWIFVRGEYEQIQ